MFRSAVIAIFCLLPGVGPASAMLHPLCQAALDGDAGEITRLLDAGAPVDRCWTGYTPLMFAAEYGRTEAARMLIARGADIHHRDHNGDRALLWAAREGHADIIRLLLTAGDTADSALDPYGQSPLYKAALWGHTDAVRILLEAGANPRSREQTEETPLHAATTYGFPAVVRLLLKAGADPNAVEEIFAQTPLHLAAKDGDAEALRLLIDAGGDVRTPDRDGMTPLHHAASTAMPATAALLLERGADADARAKNGATPFSLAVSPVHERKEEAHAVVALLADKVTDLDSAFAEAVWGGHAAAAIRLAERGARTTGQDTSGRSALAGAVMNEGMAVFNLVLAGGADVERDGPEALAYASEYGRDDIVKRLLQLGVPIDARTETGRTGLALAGASGRVGVAALLIERGADKYPRDAEGRTIEDLMHASRTLIESLIDMRSASRAWHPTDHLEAELAALTRNQQAILALLGR